MSDILALASDRKGNAIKVKPRTLKPNATTAATLGVRPGMSDGEALAQIGKATSATMPTQGVEAVAELRACANAVAAVHVRVATKLRELANELEALSK